MIDAKTYEQYREACAAVDECHIAADGYYYRRFTVEGPRVRGDDVAKAYPLTGFERDFEAELRALGNDFVLWPL